MNFIKSINWITTYQCNLRCHHCDIWENPYSSMMSRKQIQDFFGSDIIKKSYHHYKDFFDIAISGGEPLLVKDLETIYDTIDDILPGAIHSISTNGTLEQKLLRFLIHIKKRGNTLRKVNISIDGGESSHDRQRGISGSFRKSLHTIQKVKKIFPEQIIEIKLTITKKNFRDIHTLSRLASKLGIFFSFKPVENMTSYTNQKRTNDIDFSPREIDEIEAQIIGNTYIEKQNYYISQKFFSSIPDYLRKGLGEKKKLCTVSEESITLMPDGKIYGCILMQSVGDISKQAIDVLWNDTAIKNQRIDIKKGACPECMLMCGAFKSKDIYA